MTENSFVRRRRTTVDPVRCLHAAVALLALTPTLLLKVSAQGSEGYFNGSAFAILKNTLDVRHVTSLGFRTCSRGLLFHQSGAGGDSLKLELKSSKVSPGYLRLQWNSARKEGFVEVGHDLSDNRWHSVLLSYALGEITLTVDDRVTLVANSTHNAELLHLDLLSPNPEVVVGQGFEGCLLQGAGLVLGESTVTSVGVNWTECPLPDRGDCDGYRVDYCFSQPCHKHGTCLSTHDGYQCLCTTRYAGRNCETDTGPLCEKENYNRCRNGGICQEDPTGNYTTCACPPKFTGLHCEMPIDAQICDSNPCHNNATCHLNQYGDDFECSCLPGFAGLKCEVDIDECSLSPCQHGGTCVDGVNAHGCVCDGTGYVGVFCESNIDECVESQPCINGGRCFDTYGSYFCECRLGLSGKNCERLIDECSSTPCLNGATCLNLLNRYQCTCATGYQGANCEINIDDCLGVRCLEHAHCVDGVNDHECVCDDGFIGSAGHNCTNVNECLTDPCSNGGTCVDDEGGRRFHCLCVSGFAGPTCSEAVDECDSSPCENGGTCVDGLSSYECRCPIGYEGAVCSVDVDECLSSPCLNGGTCVDGVGDYECRCSSGWSGKNCDADVDECASSPCENDASCKNADGRFECGCLRGFTGRLCEVDVDDCASTPCLNNGTCSDLPGAFECRCAHEFDGPTCAAPYDHCTVEPCQNGGTCRTEPPERRSTCTCPSGFGGDRCEVNVDDCVGVICSRGLICVDLIDAHECRCPLGFESPSTNCEHEIDECLSAPCRNGATCLDGVANFTCVCPAGYTGAFCEEDIDECVVNGVDGKSSPCVHGICANRPGTYQCYCQPGFSGNRCDREYDECLSRPCRNGATCQDMVNDYLCICSPGYTGKECETDIDECQSAPCLNGGSCTDRVADFTCECPAGFTGVRCETDIDECASTPCLNDGRCVDRVNGFHCECQDTGFDGDFCQKNIDDCASSPCVNDGNCTDLIKNYSCTCHPGYAGQNCQEDVAECEVTPCQNGAQCYEKSNASVYALEDSARPVGFPRGPFSYGTGGGYLCICARGFTGEDCEINIDDCETNTCTQNGDCVDGIDSYECKCHVGFEGHHCETEIDECRRFRPCAAGSYCQDRIGDYFCRCPPGIGGKNCTVTLRGCEINDCLHDGSCVPYLEGEDMHLRNCSCTSGFNGDTCQLSTTMSFSRGAAHKLLIMGNPSHDYSLSMQLRTTLPDGLLAYGHGIGSGFLLYLMDGVVHFQLGGDGPVSANSSVALSTRDRINDGLWWTLNLAFPNHDVTLQISNGMKNVWLNKTSPITSVFNVASSSETALVPKRVYVATYVARAADRMKFEVGGFSIPNFVGCMQDVRVSGDTIVPGLNLADSGGSLRYIIDVAQGCPRMNQCLPSTCNGGGRCVDLWTDYVCHCVRPHHGLHCEHEFEAATFNHENVTDSLAMVTIPRQQRLLLRHNASISMFIRTRSADGLVFYLGNGNSLDGAANADTFLAAELESGVLRTSVKINGTPESLIDKKGRRLDDGYYHLIVVSLVNRTLSAAVNGTNLFRMDVEANGDTVLDAQHLFLGGLPPPPSLSPSARNRRQLGFSEPAHSVLGPHRTVRPSTVNFKGVMQDIRVNDWPVNLFSTLSPRVESPLGDNVTLHDVVPGVQSDDACRTDPCRNEGNCSVTWNDYVCRCPRGFRGKNCTQVEFCAFNECPHSAECRSLSDGYECISNATFNGLNSSISYVPHLESNVFLDSVSFNFRTKSGGPVLRLWQGNRSMEFVVADNEMRVLWSLSSTQKRNASFSLVDSTEVQEMDNNNNWHSVNLSISGTTLTMSLNGGHPMISTVTPLWTLSQMILETVGSDNTKIEVAAGMLGERYRGCLREVRLGEVLLPFFPRIDLANDTAVNYFVAERINDVEIDCVLCYDTECKHDSVCLDRYDDYACNCSDGFEGQFCQVDVDECADIVCDNGGTCRDGHASFHCECVSGFDGERCELEIDECASDPCLNGGVCFDLLNAYSCNCTANYTGINCEKEKSFDCSSHPCTEGATCENTPFNRDVGYHCLCPVGRTGLICEAEIDYCAENPCRNGASCHSVHGSYACTCTKGYEGIDCDRKIDYCSARPCYNGAECRSNDTSFECQCTIFFKGPFCKEDVDECSEGTFICVNHASCHNLNGGYECLCRSGNTGTQCQLPDPCVNESLCLNGGTCVPYTFVNSVDPLDELPGYNCTCAPNFEGKNCEKGAHTGGGLDSELLGIVVGCVVGATVLIVAVALTVFLTMARKKRATRGTYSPSRQEMFGSRVELGDVMKAPPAERLI